MSALGEETVIASRLIRFGRQTMVCRPTALNELHRALMELLLSEVVCLWINDDRAGVRSGLEVVGGHRSITVGTGRTGGDDAIDR